jgi:hypothetical protein
MSQVIRISDKIYERLESLAKGFDTPGNVIERLLIIYDNQSKLGSDGSPGTSPNIKIASLVKKYAEEIIKYCIKENEIDKLKSKSYSKQAFGIHFPFCKEVDKNLNKKLPRYWKKIFIVEERRFVVTSEWYARNKNLFLNWLKERKIYVS